MLIYDKKKRAAILKACKIIDKTIGSTMGIGGKLVMYQREDLLYPSVTKDGVSVANMITSKEDDVRIIIDMIRQACHKQVEEVGDGTTLTAILTCKLLKEGLKQKNISLMLENIKGNINKIISVLNKTKREDLTRQESESIATVALNGNKELAVLVVDAIVKSGDYGLVTIEKAESLDSSVDLKDGYSWNSGVEMHSFNSGYGLILQNAKVLVTDHNIRFAQDILKLTNKLFDASGKNAINMPPLLAISPDISDEALSAMINARKQGIHIYHLKPEGIITERENCLLDIASYVDAEFVSMDAGDRLDRLELSCLGEAKEVMANKMHSLILSENQNIDDRVSKLKTLVKETKVTGEKEIYQKSLARLTGGVAVIKIGGKTISEQLEIIDRVDDAVKATKSAMKYGYVDGGGVALLLASKQISNKIVKSVICEPINRILANADMVHKKEIIRSIFKMGFGSYEIKEKRSKAILDKTMFYNGIIDPYMVIKLALQNALSVASLILQSSVIITKE